MIDHRSYARSLGSCEIKARKKLSTVVNGIRTIDLCDTGTVLYQLSCQAIWELVTLGVRNISVDDKNASEYINLRSCRTYGVLCPLSTSRQS